VVTEADRSAIPWKGIHWPLLDEDLAVGPLVEGMRPK
jgi:hypothetical protein